MTPKKAIRSHCFQCAGSADQVRNCGGHKMLGDQGNPEDGGRCWFYAYLLGKGRPSVKIIREHCLECMGGSRKQVRNCLSYTCPLHEFRMGTNPNRTKKKCKIPVKETA